MGEEQSTQADVEPERTPDVEVHGLWSNVNEAQVEDDEEAEDVEAHGLWANVNEAQVEDDEDVGKDDGEAHIPRPTSPRAQEPRAL